MTKFHRLAAGSAAMALIASSITPAVAGGRWGRGWGWGSRHHDRVSVDDVLTGIFVIGAIAAISNGLKSKKRNRSERVERDDDSRRNEPSGSRGRIASESDAVDACAEAVEDRSGNAASVREIGAVVSQRDGWDVDGIVERRDGWRSRSADKVKFSCSVRFGRVESVSIGSGIEA